MKKFFSVLFTIVLLTGCISSDDSDYTVDRKRDFNDIFHTGVMLGVGGKAQTGPINLSLGLLLTHLTERKIKIISAGIGSEEKYLYEKINWARNKNYKAVSIAGISYAEPLNQNIANYYTQFDAGFGTPLGGLYFGFNPGELLDWSLGYFGVDVYDDNIGLPSTFEDDLLALNQFFINHSGNLSLTDQEQTVLCYEYENARVYEFENYSLAVFPLYWQKYGVYDFIVFVNDSIPHCERLTNFGTIRPKYNPQNLVFNAKDKVGFFDKFIGDKISKRENNGHHRKYDDGSINKDYTDIEHKNGEDTYIQNRLAIIRIYGNFDVSGIKKIDHINSDTTRSYQNNDYMLSDLVSKKEIKITLPVNKIK